MLATPARERKRNTTVVGPARIVCESLESFTVTERMSFSTNVTEVPSRSGAADRRLVRLRARQAVFTSKPTVKQRGPTKVEREGASGLTPHWHPGWSARGLPQRVTVQRTT
jgi:hypothetical protein